MDIAVPHVKSSDKVVGVPVFPPLRKFRTVKMPSIQFANEVVVDVTTVKQGRVPIMQTARKTPYIPQIRDQTVEVAGTGESRRRRTFNARTRQTIRDVLEREAHRDCGSSSSRSR